jgi:tetratricopeptide (TPR) repeat protein
MRLHAIGELDAALAMLTDSLNRARQVGGPAALAPAMIYVATVRAWRGEYDLAARVQKEALPIAIDLRNPNWTIHASFILGLALVNQGRISEGVALLCRTLEQLRRNGAWYHLGRLSNTIGWAYREMGDFERAVEYDQSAIESSSKYKAIEAEISSWVNMTREFTRTGQMQRARETLHMVEEMAKPSEWHRWLFMGIRCQAVAAEHFLVEGDLDRAARHLETLRANAVRLDIRKYAATACRIAASIAAARGDLAAAEGELLAGIDMLKTRPAPLAAWRLWADLASARARRGDRSGAKQALSQTTAIIQAIADSIIEEDLRSKFLKMTANKLAAPLV